MTKETKLAPPPCCTLSLSGPQQKRFVRMAKALGNPVRFEILKFMVTHPGCINTDLVAYLPIAQATVSQHLRVLKDAGWIAGTIHGKGTSYCLDSANIAWYKQLVGEIF